MTIWNDLARFALETQSLPRARGRAFTALALSALNLKRRGWARVPLIGDYFFRKQIRAALKEVS